MKKNIPFPHFFGVPFLICSLLLHIYFFTEFHLNKNGDYSFIVDSVFWKNFMNLTSPMFVYSLLMFLPIGIYGLLSLLRSVSKANSETKLERKLTVLKILYLFASVMSLFIFFYYIPLGIGRGLAAF